MAFVGDRVTQHAQQYPHSPALACGTRSWSWTELLESTEKLAAGIAARVPDVARVAVSLEDPADLLIAFLAAARARALAMVYDPAWPRARHDWVVAQTRPDLFIDAEFFEAVQGGSASGSVFRPEPQAADLFYAGFTSGSTGDPKGYCRTHRSWLESFELSDAEFAIQHGDTVVIPGNMVHSLHLYGAVHGLVAGAMVHLVPRFQPRHVVAMLRSVDSSILYATPTQIHYVAEELRRTGPADAVRLVLASGAKWQAEDRRAMTALFPKARLVEFYGASEMSFITVSAPEDAVPDGSVGRVARNVDICIGETPDAQAPVGNAGLIWVRSALLFDSYICGGGSEIRWHREWLTVGDHGWLDRDGFLFLAGREKRMIVTSGINVYPEEIEQVLSNHPDVRSAALFGLPDRVRGARLVAAVQREGKHRISDAELRRYCLLHLGRTRTPRVFHHPDFWPLTPGGKTDLKMLERELLNSACEARAG